ncbi:CstA-like transporter-associated (seleno)protein [Aneurinibacillus sp. REN35]|uniref:CstA-like transporter-associated (seleno)protein n=1 Tax=Aneurinibacillus sp. REN35 TaxID=3237286 RepID=UPI0035298B03
MWRDETCPQRTYVPPEKIKEVAATHSLMRRVRSTFRMVFGIPDYERYLDYWHAAPPKGELTPLSEKEFFRQAIEQRYGSGKPTRCC